MKKKFLGLAMAVMVAIPATGVYAAETESTKTGYKIVDDQGVTNADQQGVNTTVPVTGEVLNSNNQSGKIQVEIPTLMQFTVDKDSKVDGPQYEVTNKGANAIDIYVASFIEESDSTIHIKPESDIKADNQKPSDKEFARNTVSLKIEGKVDNQTQSIDLGSVNQSLLTEDNRKLAKLDAGDTQVMKLSGIAGNKEDSELNAKGTTNGKFKLSFKIKKSVD